MNRELIHQTLFNLLKSRLETLTIIDEPATIPQGKKYVVSWASRFISAQSVTDDQGVSFTHIDSGTPMTNQYMVDSSGMFTFAEADIGRKVLISYTFTGIINASRRLMHWSDVSYADTPVMYLVRHSESNQKARGLTDRWTLNFHIYVYVITANDIESVPAMLMNPILDSIQAMFEPDDMTNYALTLDGLVSHVAIQGEIETDEGLLGDKAVSIIPVEVLVPI